MLETSLKTMLVKYKLYQLKNLMILQMTLKTMLVKYKSTRNKTYRGQFTL